MKFLNRFMKLINLFSVLGLLAGLVSLIMDDSILSNPWMEHFFTFSPIEALFCCAIILLTNHPSLSSSIYRLIGAAKDDRLWKVFMILASLGNIYSIFLVFDLQFNRWPTILLLNYLVVYLVIHQLNYDQGGRV